MRLTTGTIYYLIITSVGTSYGGDAQGTDYAGDRLVFAKRRKPLSEGLQKVAAEDWRCNSDIRDRAGSSYPFWDDVELGDFWPRPESRGYEGVSAIHRRGTDEYAWPAWHRLGPFIKDVRTARQCGFVLEVLHENWFKERLTGQQCVDIVRQVEKSAGNLPLQVKRPVGEHDSMTAECVLKDGVWLTHFGLIEGASLVEYKYAISTHDGIVRSPRLG